MKKNDAILITAVTAYSILFYRQSAGINFFLFNLILIVLLFIQKQSLAKNRLWLIAAAGTLISGISAMLYGNGLTVISSIASLLLLSATSFSKNSSVILGFLYSIYSSLSAVVFIFIDVINKRKSAENTGAKKGRTFLTILIALAVLIFFFIMYRESNPLFKDFTRNINLDFISFEWIRFTLLGFILLYGFFYHRNIQSIYKYDLEGRENAYTLEQDKIKPNKISEWLGMSKELTLGISLFALLNVMILFVNALDIVYLWIGNVLPDNLDYSSAVHQSVGNLITSILAAIVLILFFFRADLNYIKNNKTLKLLALLWILQNAILVASTIYRNQMYIAEFALTQKRIGVYFYLLLCLAGLLSAGIKIYKIKRNWYLFRFNGMAVYVLLVTSTLINWDAIITRYNLKHTVNADYQYLINLNNSNLPELQQFFNSEEFRNQPQNTILGMFDKLQLKNQSDRKLYEFFKGIYEYDFRSWNYDDIRIKSSLIQLSKQGIITSLDLSGGSIQILSPLACLENIKELNISRNHYTSVHELSIFPKLRLLDLSGNNINSIDSLPSLANLENLDLSLNFIKYFSKLGTCKNLITLNISNNGVIDMTNIENLKSLRELDISGNTVLNASRLSKLQNLKTLRASQMPYGSIYGVPSIPGLEDLTLSNNGITDTSILLTNQLCQMNNLRSIDLSSNAIERFVPTMFLKVQKENETNKASATEGITIIDLSSNKINIVGDLSMLKNLKELHLGYNIIFNIENISTVEKLEQLYIQGNRITDISPLLQLVNLKHLDISSNPLRLSSSTKLPSLLEYLNISDCDLADMEFLNQFKCLKTLNVSNTNLEDLATISKMKTLTTLNISGNTKITNLKPLYVLKNLSYLIIPKVSNEKFQKLQKALPKTTIYMSETVTNSSDTSYDR